MPIHVNPCQSSFDSYGSQAQLAIDMPVQWLANVNTKSTKKAAAVHDVK